MSVILIPVSFCLVAVFMMVFGVAYYFQNRNRFMVEVADFNFGETQSVDMEYKTFHQRLIDSICEVLIRNNHSNNNDGDTNSDEGNDSNIRYGSMT